MLKNTFIHIPGVGRIAERALWESGCLEWGQYLDNPGRFSIGTASPSKAVEVLTESQRHLDSGMHQYFQRALGLAESWRAFPDFRDDCVYLDIETDGGQAGDSITMVGLYDGLEFRCLVRDEDLSQFPDLISHYKMIVTFFGSGFDLPMLQRKFPSVEFDQIHLDLCPTLKKLGLRGGLKKIEASLGLARSEDTTGLSGWDAVRLWRQYERGSDRALETLIAYNREDVVNLEFLAELAYSRLRIATLPDAAQPAVES